MLANVGCKELTLMPAISAYSAIIMNDRKMGG